MEVERQCPRHNACRTNPIFRDTHLLPPLEAGREREREKEQESGTRDRGETGKENGGREEIEDG